MHMLTLFFCAVTLTSQLIQTGAIIITPRVGTKARSLAHDRKRWSTIWMADRTFQSHATRPDLRALVGAPPVYHEQIGVSLSPLNIYEQKHQIPSQALSGVELSGTAALGQQEGSSDLVSKSSLRFILDTFVSDEESAIDREEEHTLSSTPTAKSEPAATARGSVGLSKRPGSRICKFQGCEQYVVDSGLCVRHGGGKRCSVDGCTSRAKNCGRCWKHGGSIECTVVDCMNRAKSRGFCWSHGGGTKCKLAACDKIAISNGLCWAHGGGKRCTVTGCRKQAFERTHNLCNHHFLEQTQTLSLRQINGAAACLSEESMQL